MTLPDGFTEAREAHERGECRPEDRCFFCPPHPWEPTPTEAEYRARLHAETLVSVGFYLVEASTLDQAIDRAIARDYD